MIIMIRVAYHLHTKEAERPFRVDGAYSAEEMFRILYEQDVRVMGITDKNSVTAIKKLKMNGYEEQYKSYVPVGAEIHTKEGFHLLVAFEGLDSYIEELVSNGSMISYIDIAKNTKHVGGRVILPHMFTPRIGIGREGGLELCDKGLVDAVEWNFQSKIREKRNEKAIEFAEETNLPLVYGCDGYWDVGKVIMNVNAEDPREAFGEMLKGRFEVEIGKPSSLWNIIRKFYYGMRTEPLPTIRVLLDLLNSSN